jgi:hypothetical protein
MATELRRIPPAMARLPSGCGARPVTPTESTKAWHVKGINRTGGSLVSRGGMTVLAPGGGAQLARDQ